MPKPVIQCIQANKVAVKHTNGIASYVVKGNDRNFHSLLYLSEKYFWEYYMHISTILFRTFKANVFQRDIKDKNSFLRII